VPPDLFGPLPAASPYLGFILLKVLEKSIFVALSILLLVSIIGGPEFLQYLGLGVLGRWGALLLWLGCLVFCRFNMTSLVPVSRKWRSGWIFVVVLGVSLVLRWPMGNLDLEHYVGPDEGEMVENTLEMMKTRYFHQRHPGYPGLLFYLQMIPATTHLLLSTALGEGTSIRELPREGFYRVIRRFTLLAGWFSAMMVYLIGRRWLGRFPAALAGALVALSPLAFRESGVVNPDLLLMIFVTVGLWQCLRIVEKPETASFVWAGVWVGLATAIKYTGALLIVPYAVAWLYCGGGRPPRWGAGRGGGF
jgi:hypothetical protein